MSNIDITKTYQTRDGREVRIYAGDGHGMFPIHAAVKDACGWHCGSWLRDGKTSLGPADNPSDLVPVKTWRAWKDGEAPKICMLKNKTSGTVSIFRTEGWKKDFRAYIFHEYVRVHEDGSETPCGVLEQ